MIITVPTSLPDVNTKFNHILTNENLPHLNLNTKHINVVILLKLYLNENLYLPFLLIQEQRVNVKIELR